jgi:hypothetical protein
MRSTAIVDTRRMAETGTGSGRSPSGDGARSAIAQPLPINTASMKRDLTIMTIKAEYNRERDKLAAKYQAMIDDAWREYRNEARLSLGRAITQRDAA